MKDYQQRVIEENADLSGKIERLEAFRALDAWRALPKAEKDRMNAQLMFMRGYALMLRQRIDAFGGADDEDFDWAALQRLRKETTREENKKSPARPSPLDP